MVVSLVMNKRFYVTLILILSLVSLGGKVGLHLDGSSTSGHLHEDYAFSYSMLKQASYLDGDDRNKITNIPKDTPILLQKGILFISSNIVSSFPERSPPA